MRTLDFPYHSVGDEYPESSTLIRFGGGYSFATKPKGPDQITFHLNFEAMFWWINIINRSIDRTFNSQINCASLQDFYEYHRMYELFTYNHPSRGQTAVRFAKPLPPFKSMPDKITYNRLANRAGHQIEPFTVDLIMQP